MTAATTTGGRRNCGSWKIPHGDPGALTLKQHWDAAVTAYGWPSDPHDLIDFTGRPFHALTGCGKNNRAFFLWYQRLLDKCRDYAMKHAAYDLILAQWPSCGISNYEDTNIPQGYTVDASDVFGWQFDFSTANDPVPQPQDSFPSREFPLGYFKPQNASYGVEDSGTYFITPGNYRSGTMNAPVLYSVGTVHHTNGESEVIQRNLYEPHADDCATVQSGDCVAPIETHWQAAMRTHRHWLESILLSGDEPETISPLDHPTDAIDPRIRTEGALRVRSGQRGPWWPWREIGTALKTFTPRPARPPIDPATVAHAPRHPPPHPSPPRADRRHHHGQHQRLGDHAPRRGHAR